jgi:hypothetical protein
MKSQLSLILMTVLTSFYSKTIRKGDKSCPCVRPLLNVEAPNEYFPTLGKYFIPSCTYNLNHLAMFMSIINSTEILHVISFLTK